MAVTAQANSKGSTYNLADNDKISDNDSPQPEKDVQDTTDNEYPQGIRRILLAGASVVAVFLIALDQVSDDFSAARIARVADNSRPLDNRRHRNP
jgi:MFS transporter, DHA2 family, glioxin efflux transporter